jgi:uroporphyrinogen-III synthase
VDAGALAGSVALLHSVRAARRLRMIAPGDVVIAALSPVVAAAAGEGWTSVHAARVPTDAALLDLAETLAD